MKTPTLIFLCLSLFSPNSLDSAEPSSESSQAWKGSRCEVLPLPSHQTVFLCDGVETLRWHHDPAEPRPFFFPFMGPSGTSLTRMGHPGAPDHDHHDSIWFAHNKVDGVNFWANDTGAKIRQKQWFAYEDGDQESRMAVELGWFDEKETELMTQELIVATIPGENGEQFLEIQTTLRAASGRESVTLERTNFGLLAVRVAKSISHRFGGGELVNSEGLIGEKAIFGQNARWMDYSGPVWTGTGPERRLVTEGITYFDHPGNLGYPSAWHVRADGWMCSSPCFEKDLIIKKDESLQFRWLLHAHAGGINPARANSLSADFAKRPQFLLQKNPSSGARFTVSREP